MLLPNLDFGINEKDYAFEMQHKFLYEEDNNVLVTTKLFVNIEKGLIISDTLQVILLMKQVINNKIPLFTTSSVILPIFYSFEQDDARYGVNE